MNSISLMGQFMMQINLCATNYFPFQFSVAKKKIASTDDPLLLVSPLLWSVHCLSPSLPSIIQWFLAHETTPLVDNGNNIQLLEDSHFLYLRGVTTSTIEYQCVVTNARVRERVSGTTWYLHGQFIGTGLTEGERYVDKEIKRIASVGESNFVFA